jgi:hypothetical protein
MTTKLQKSKLPLLFLALILIVAMFLRSYKIHEFLGDWHSWRQADTASVAREYVKAGRIDLLQPKFHDLSSVPSGLNNPSGYRMVEFPLRDAMHARIALSFPSLGFLEIGRGMSIAFSLITIVIIYLIVTPLSGTVAALASALVYAILPYSMFYGRVILPEPMLVMFSMLTLYLYIKYIDTGKLGYWITGLLSLSCAILLKPTSLIILLPMIGYFLVSSSTGMKKGLASLALPVVAIFPYYLWRKHIASFPEGIPASSWLFNSNGIRFKGAWFRWLFGERIGKMILGYWGLIPLGFGLAKLGDDKKSTMVYGGLLLGSLTYLAVIATGNVQHDYYQIQIMPTIAILAGVGISYMLELKKGFAKIIPFALILFVLGLSTALSWYELKGFFWVNNRAMVEAGQYIDANTNGDALVIAPYQGDTAFLYQTNRRGWPIGGEIEVKIKAGADYYVTTSRDQEFNELKSKYPVLIENDRFAVIDLSSNGKTGLPENRSTK